MLSYTKTNVNIISLVMCLIIFFSLNSIYSFSNRIYYASTSRNDKKEQSNQEIISNNIDENIINNKNISENKGKKVKQNKNTEWKIEIKTISLSAQISEGTTDKVMNKYVGHFENTSKKEGNIGLAAHNRGYPVNYFQNLKKLKKGDEIKYTYGKFKKTYVVEKIEIIKDTDWEYLENTKENKITLITCVENEPNYRRCIQGIEK